MIYVVSRVNLPRVQVWSGETFENVVYKMMYEEAVRTAIPMPSMEEFIRKQLRRASFLADADLDHDEPYTAEAFVRTLEDLGHVWVHISED